jgi:hypothetical protein
MKSRILAYFRRNELHQASFVIQVLNVCFFKAETLLRRWQSLIWPRKSPRFWNTNILYRGAKSPLLVWAISALSQPYTLFLYRTDLLHVVPRSWGSKIKILYLFLISFCERRTLLVSSYLLNHAPQYWPTSTQHELPLYAMSPLPISCYLVS